ncbi:MAG: hypothetical protein HYX32_00410 [Actinobacteria bacterium]|nr:hypothetical protein [Actinomycetota bacterium]
MTATATDKPTRPTRRSRYQVPAELALALVSLAVVVGFNRVFVDSSFLGPLLVVVVYSHVMMALGRRRGWGIGLSGLVGFLGLGLVVTYLLYLSSVRYGLPSGATLEVVRASLSQSWNTFQNVTAPAPTETGFLLASAIALYFAVFLADWAAFRLWSAWEAIVPASTLFIFCSLLGSVVNRVMATGIFIAAALAFILLHTVAKRETSAGWLSSDIDRGSAALFKTGALLAAFAAVAGIVLGPAAPGADSNPVLCWNKCAEGKGAGDRFTISPLVEIQTRMIDQANVELFDVESSEPAYWRLTSLDTFDGSSWRSKGKFTAAEGDLGSPDIPAANSLVEQKYTITGLARLWLPAAYQPVYVSKEASARYQADSSTLIVDTQLETSDGLAYTVKSKIPAFTPDQLRNADTSIPEDISTRYLSLPADFSLKARDAAQAKTAGKDTTYDKMRALQDWFQGPEFKYNLKVPPGSGERAIDDFLDNKEGYCEQYAGTMAAMARSLGVPSRVAVGFTWGEADQNNPNLYHVRGEHAHAWPEVYLGQYGWVAFEPTPGRGAPNMQSWTDVKPNQVGQDPNATPSTTVAPGGSVPGTTPAPTPAPAPLDPNALNTNSGQTSASDNEAAGLDLRWILGPLFVLVLLAGAYALVVSSIRRSFARRRRHRATEPSARVRVAWQESVEDLELVGVAPLAAETNDEFAVRAGATIPETSAVLIDLAHHTDAATFAEHLVDGEAAHHAEGAASTISTAVRERTTSGRRFANHLDPRPIFRRRKGTPRHSATSNR